MAAVRVQVWLDENPPERRLIGVAHGGVGRLLRGLYAKFSIAETLAQDQPQDALFQLHRGAVERIEVDSAD